VVNDKLAETLGNVVVLIEQCSKVLVVSHVMELLQMQYHMITNSQ
jgi:hypothetical protein